MPLLINKHGFNMGLLCLTAIGWSFQIEHADLKESV
jgi:hypothetical protein